MQTSRFAATVLAASLAAANVAWAQGDTQNVERADPHIQQPREPSRTNSRDRGQSQMAQRHDNRGNSNGWNRGNDRQQGRSYDRDGPHDGYVRNDRSDHRNWGAGPDHNFYRGGYLPREYRSRQYVVDDWRGHHLRPPPRGYHWVQTGGDYVLAAIATGVITSIILNAAANN
ncbi:MAG TPA: RcnB family protein [Caldimonas sp.]|nr:RcnB family protein [Caldimonas sp.]